MKTRAFAAAVVAASAALLVPGAARAGIEACNDIDSRCTAEAEGSATCSASREPPRLPPIIPGVIVLAAIGATVAVEA